MPLVFRNNVQRDQKHNIPEIILIEPRVSRFLFNNHFDYTMYYAQLIGFCRYMVHFTKDIV
jgi:hypothetical protein